MLKENDSNIINVNWNLFEKEKVKWEISWLKIKVYYENDFFCEFLVIKNS